MLQVLREARQAFLDLGADRVVGIDRHLRQQAIEAVQNGIGQPLVQPGPSHDGVGPFMHHLAHEVFVRFERAACPANAGIEQRAVAAIRNGTGQHPAEQGR